MIYQTLSVALRQTILKSVKATMIAVAILSFQNVAQAQLKLGNNPGTINPSAILEMETTSKGLLIPRMTATEMAAISTPANGLMVYNTDESCFFVYRVSVWRSLCDDYTFKVQGTTRYVNQFGDDALGAYRTGNLGLGTNNPLSALHVFAATNPMRVEGLQMGTGTDSIVTIDMATGIMRRRDAATLTGGYLTASNGITKVGNDFQLGGALSQNTTINTAGFDFRITGGNFGLGTAGSPTNTFHVSTPAGTDPVRIEGLRSGTATDSIMTVDASGVVHMRDAATVVGNYLTASNGLTKVANDFQLGGTLTKNTAISFAGFNLGLGIAAGTASSRFHLNGSMALGIRTSAANATLDAADNTILMDCTGGARSLGLPAASSCSGRIYYIAKIDDSSNPLNFSVTLKLDNAAGLGSSMNSINHTSRLTIQSDGTDWWLLNKF